MKTLVAVVVALAFVLAPMGLTEASGSSSCRYLTGAEASYLIIQGAQGQQFRAHDLQGVLRVQGMVASAHFGVPVIGPAADALVVTLGGSSIVVLAEHDDLWQ